MVNIFGAATAAEVVATGVEWMFAPTFAVPQDLGWGRTYEGYAGDPALVARYARAMTLGLQGPIVAGKPIGPGNVAATAKHFLADGGTADGKDPGDANLLTDVLKRRMGFMGLVVGDWNGQGQVPVCLAGRCQVSNPQSVVSGRLWARLRPSLPMSPA